MSMLRVVIAGGRKFTDRVMCETECERLIKEYMNMNDCDEVEVISGRAVGADTLSYDWAVKIGIPVVSMYADWDGKGKQAGFIRNVEMAEYAVADDSYGLLIAFWDGESKGTKHMIDTAVRKGLAVEIVSY